MDSSDSSRAAARLLVLVPTLVLQLHQCGFSAINTIMVANMMTPSLNVSLLPAKGLTLQHRLAKRLPIPIATSSLLQVPSVLAILPPTKSLGIITYDADRFGYEHLGQLGVSEPNHHRIHIMGAPHKGHLQRLVQSGSSSSPTGKNSIPYVHADLETELIERSKELLSAHQDIGALLVLQRCSQKVSLLVEDLKPECNFGDDRPKLEGPRYCRSRCLLGFRLCNRATNGAGSNGCLREKLRLTCPLQSDEESGGFRDRPTACQQAVVLDEHTKVNGVRIDPERRRLNGIYSVTSGTLPPSALVAIVSGPGERDVAVIKKKPCAEFNRQQTTFREQYR
ncbi:hypothetical protein KC360_g77 [Hortaea werneckii]|nr:hypothetical protein KC360_g77 [Hortaea werneckii]